MSVVTISVDVGTSVVKAVGYDADGQETGVARRASQVDRPGPGRAEQDVEAVRRRVLDVVEEVARSGGGSEEVDLVSVTAQGDGCWLVDVDGAPTGTGLLWNDGRAGAQVRTWQADGVLADGFARTGSMTFSGLANALLAWCAEHEPARLDKAAAALSCGGVVHAALTGRTAIETTDASAPFLPAGETAWAEDLFALYGLDWARDLFPDPLAEDDRSRPLVDGLAATLGLADDAVAVMAPYDVPSTVLGSGAVRVGEACAILGTTLCTATVIGADEPVRGPEAGLRLRSGVPGQDLRVMPTAAGTDVLDWACGLVGVDAPVDLVALASQSPAGARGLVFLPYLSPAGERAPFLDPGARGSLHGLSLEHGREDLARAVLEGLTHAVRDCVAMAGPIPTVLRLAGGGSHNDTWAQLVADVVGCPVTRCQDAEVGARGAYLAGLVARRDVSAGRITAADVAEVADHHVAAVGRLEPDPAVTACYDDLHARFLELREAVAPTWATAPGAGGGPA